MLVLGTSYLAAKALVWLFCAVVCGYLFLLVRRTHGELTATVTVLLFGLSPLILLLARQVMLEVPALAFALAAVYHFVAYLDDPGGRRRDVYLAAAASAGFALTRFDALFLLAFFGLSLLALRRFDVLRRRETWLAALLALALVLPVYVPMLAQFGRAHILITLQGGADPSPGLGFFGALAFYPRALPGQIGWPTLVPALAGLLAALGPARRRACWPYLVLAAATWLAFAPLAERQVRHTIYWVPAFALFAWEGAAWIPSRLQLPQARAAILATSALLVCGAFWIAVPSRVLYVRGYGDAARYVVANSRASRFTFMDGFLNGDFIYQVRRHDPHRRLWVLRGDKLLYSVLVEPSGGYKEYAGGEEKILATLFRYDPEYLVVEEPQVLFKIPMADRLRRTLAAHPERFERVNSIPVESNVPAFRGVRLDVYRSRLRNPSPERRLSLDMMGLGRSLGTEVR